MDNPHPHLVRVHFSTSVFGMLCINVLVRRPWTEAEKLSYPIIQLPLQMTDASVVSPFESNDVDWIWVGRRTRYSQRTSFPVSNYPRSGRAAL